MTANQAHLIAAEINRHISLALIAKEPEIKRGHMEVVDALTASLIETKEGRSAK